MSNAPGATREESPAAWPEPRPRRCLQSATSARSSVQLKALDRVSLDDCLWRRFMRLLGENGAGKSTLCNVDFWGSAHRTKGEMHLAGAVPPTGRSIPPSALAARHRDGAPALQSGARPQRRRQLAARPDARHPEARGAVRRTPRRHLSQQYGLTLDPFAIVFKTCRSASDNASRSSSA